MWIVLFLVLPCVAGAVLAVARRPEVRVAPEVAADLDGVRRHRQARQALGPVVGLTLAVLVLAVGPVVGAGLGLAVPLAVAAGLVGLLATVCVAELTVRPAATARRTASLDARRITDLLPAGEAGVAAAGVLTLTALLAVGWALGDPDDRGRAGRWLVTAYVDADGNARTSGHGPWPGSFYAVPLLVVVALSVLLTVVTLVAVSRRARPSARSTEADLVLRRGVARAVLQGLAATGWLLAAGVAALMTAGVFAVDGAPRWYAGLGVATLALTLVGAALGSWSLGRVLVEPEVVVVERQSVAS